MTANTAKPPAGLRQNIIAFYADPNAPISTKKNPRQWKKVQDALAVLSQSPTQHIPNAK